MDVAVCACLFIGNERALICLFHFWLCAFQGKNLESQLTGHPEVSRCPNRGSAGLVLALLSCEPFRGQPAQCLIFRVHSGKKHSPYACA